MLISDFVDFESSAGSVLSKDAYCFRFFNVAAVSFVVVLSWSLPVALTIRSVSSASGSL